MPFQVQGLHELIGDLAASRIAFLDEEGLDLESSFGGCATNVRQHRFEGA